MRIQESFVLFRKKHHNACKRQQIVVTCRADDRSPVDAPGRALLRSILPPRKPTTMDDAPTPAALQLLADLDSLAGRPCRGCRRDLCGHEVLFSVALGCKDAPRCLGCLATGLARAADDLRDQLTRHFSGRDCYRLAWQTACQREGFAVTDRPACLERQTLTVAAPAPAEVTAGPPLAAWDAGELACGDLVLALRRRLNEMPAGSVLELIARDPAAPEDLPAWCRLTGHRLLSAAHPTYLIQRKGT